MIPPTTLTTALRNSADFPGGQTFGLLCSAIANAMVAWLPVGVTLQGVTSGTIGTGTVNGTMQFAGVLPSVTGVLASGGLTGHAGPRIARVLTLGLNAGLTGLTYVGVSTGVAMGTDVSRVVTANATTLSVALRSAHTALCSPLGGTGAQNPAFYTALAGGICTILMTGTTIQPTGVVSPMGPLGPGSSVGASVASFS